MRVMRCKPNEGAEMIDIDNTCEALQTEVGGLIDILYQTGNTAIVCNDEGKLLGLPPCRTLEDQNGNIVDILSGTILVVGTRLNDMTDLDELGEARWMKTYGEVQRFWRSPWGIVVTVGDEQQSELEASPEWAWMVELKGGIIE